MLGVFFGVAGPDLIEAPLPDSSFMCSLSAVDELSLPKIKTNPEINYKQDTAYEWGMHY